MRGADTVNIAIWGLPGHGKSAYLWAIGDIVPNTIQAGFKFTELGASFQRHHSRLHQNLTGAGGGWKRTEVGAGVDEIREITGGEMDLFRVQRARLLGGRHRLLIRSMDLPGETVAHISNFKIDTDAQEEGRELEKFIEKTSACLIVARAGIVEQHEELFEEGKPATNRELRNFIQKSLSLLEEDGEGATAVVLTACDEIRSPEWREKLGFGSREVSQEERCEQARSFLLDRCPELRPAFEASPDVKVFAVSPFGADPTVDEGKALADPKPAYVLEPLLWVLDREFTLREVRRRVLRVRAGLVASAVLCLLAGAVTHVGVSPLFRALGRGGLTSPASVKLSQLPHGALAAREDLSLPGLFSEAVRSARADGAQGALPALQALARLDSGGYFFSRAFLEVSRLDAQGEAGSSGEGDENSDPLARELALLERLGGALDRYGQTMLALRRLERATGRISEPGDAATGVLLEGLEDNPQLALQHGGDLLISAWRAWSDDGLSRAGVDRALERMETARAVLPAVEWRRVWEFVAPAMVVPLLSSEEQGVEQQLLRFLVSGGPEPELEQLGRRALIGFLQRGVAAPGTPEGRAAQRFAVAFSEQRALQAKLRECLPVVLETLLRSRSTESILSLNRAVLGGLRAPAASAVLAAEWSVITTASRIELESRLRSLLSLVLADLRTAEAADSLALFERFEYVIGLAAGRARVLEGRSAPLLAEASALLLERDDVVNQLSASELRVLLETVMRDTSEEGVIRVCRVSEGLDTRQAALGVSGVTELLVGLRRWTDVAEAADADVLRVVAAEVDRLGERLVAETLDELPVADVATLARTIACRYLITLDPADAAVLDGNALVICDELLTRDQWDHEASLAMASLLAAHPDPRALTRGWGRTGTLFAEFERTSDDRLGRGSAAQVALLFRAMAAVDSVSFERYLLGSREGVDGSRALVSSALIGRVVSGLDASDSTIEVISKAALRAIEQHVTALGDSVRLTAAELRQVGALVPLGDSAAVADGGGLSRLATARLQLEWLLVAASDSGEGRVEEAVARLLDIQELGSIEPGIFRRAVAELEGGASGSGAALSDVMSGLLQVRGAERTEAQDVRECVDGYLREILLSDADIGSVPVYVDALAVLLDEAPQLLAQPELKAILGSRLSAVAAGAAGRGDLALATEVWRLGARFRTEGFAAFDEWPSADAGMAAKLLTGSSLALSDGWTPGALGAAHASLLSSPGIDGAVVARLERAMVRDLIGGLAGLDGEEALRQATFALDSLVATRVSGSLAGVDERAWVDLLAEVFAWSLLEAPASERLRAFERVVPAAQESNFAERVLRLVQAISPTAESAHALLVCAGSSARPALFTPALSRWTRLDCPLTLAHSARALGAFKANVEWPAGTVDSLIDWFVSRAAADIEAVMGAGDSSELLVDWARGLDQLLDAARSLPPPLGGGTARATLEARYASAVGDALEGGVPVSRIALLAEALRPHPLVAEPANLLLVREALRAGDWDEFARRSEAIATPALSLKLKQFASVASVGTLVPLAGGGAAYLLNDEVSAGEYRAFLDAMSSEPDRVPSIAKAAGASTISGIEDLVRQSPDVGDENPRLAARGMSFDAALTYAEWRGCELPTLDVMLSCWGEELFPWGGRWNPARTNTGERSVGRRSAELEVVDAASGVLRHLHGNVSEFVLAPGDLDEVLVFGGDISRAGVSVTRARCTQSFIPSSKDRVPTSTRRDATGLRLLAVPPLELR